LTGQAVAIPAAPCTRAQCSAPWRRVTHSSTTAVRLRGRIRRRGASVGPFGCRRSARRKASIHLKRTTRRSTRRIAWVTASARACICVRTLTQRLPRQQWDQRRRRQLTSALASGRGGARRVAGRCGHAYLHRAYPLVRARQRRVRHVLCGDRLESAHPAPPIVPCGMPMRCGVPLVPHRYHAGRHTAQQAPRTVGTTLRTPAARALADAHPPVRRR
jgi:hypothetical protein